MMYRIFSRGFIKLHLMVLLIIGGNIFILSRGWSDTKEPNKQNKTTVLGDVEGRSLGCYHIKYPRKFKSEIGLKVAMQSKSNKSCMFRCRVIGLKYAVIYVTKFCFCGKNALPSRRTMKGIRCPKDCNNEAEKSKCESQHKNSVKIFKIVTPFSKVAEGNVYVGCFLQSYWNLKKYGKLYIDTELMTIERCVYSCHTWFQIFAGLYMGTQCWCANNLMGADRSMNITSNSTSCNIPCSNEAKNCGGPRHIQLHALIYVENRETPFAQYMGCFRFNEEDLNEKNNIMHSYSRTKLPQNKARKMSISRCCYLCAVKKQPYAGLTKGYLCFCSSYLNSFRKRLRSLDQACKMPCNEHRGFYCGGNTTMQIYKLRMAGYDWDTFGFSL